VNVHHPQPLLGKEGRKRGGHSTSLPRRGRGWWFLPSFTRRGRGWWFLPSFTRRGRGWFKV